MVSRPPNEVCPDTDSFLSRADIFSGVYELVELGLHWEVELQEPATPYAR